MCAKDEKLKHMGHLRVTKASLMTSKYDPRVSRFQEVYLVTWYEGRYCQVYSYSSICQKNQWPNK